MTGFHTLSQHSNPLDPGQVSILSFIHARVVRCWFPTLACSSCVASRNRLSFFLFHYLKSLICFGRVFLVTQESSGDVVVRAFASHQRGPGDPDSISRLGVIWGSSLSVPFSALRGFPPCTPVFEFLSPQKPAFD